MQIEYLSDYPDYISQVADLLHREFSYLNPAATLDGRIDILQHQLNKDAIPMTFIALADTELLASASLVEHDMDTHPELWPWLASVAVYPQHRRQGIGSNLVIHAEGEAKRIGVERLYLFTPDMEAFYKSLGWAVLQKEDYRGTPVTIMSKDLRGI